jgi:hypothetical protein
VAEKGFSVGQDLSYLGKMPFTLSRLAANLFRKTEKSFTDSANGLSKKQPSGKIL